MSESSLTSSPKSSSDGHYRDWEKSSVHGSRYRLLDEAEEVLYKPYKATSRNCNAICVAVSTILFVASLVLFSRTIYLQSNLDSTCIKRHNAYSPALDAVEYSEVQMNGSLDYPSIYRGPPTDELDAAWKRITMIGAFSVTEEEVEKLHQSKDSTQLREASGGGYMAGLEVFHHLHCLNMLRQLTWGDYYYDKEEIYTDRPEILRWHIDHCVELLRQKLMCDADVGVITYNWVPHRIHPYPNFNVWHQCRNFEKVLEWGYSHEAKDTEEDFVKLPGDVEVPPP